MKSEVVYERKAIATVCGLAYVLLASYAVARPPTESLFLQNHGSRALPSVWLVVALLTAVFVGVYKRYVHRFELASIFRSTLIVSGVSLAVLLVAQKTFPKSASFLLYVWKDVYVVLLLELLWTFANLTFPIRTARWAYSLFCTCGSLGGVSGNLLVSWLSAQQGTEAATVFVMPLLFAAWSLSFVVQSVRNTPHPQPDPLMTSRNPSSTLRVLLESPYVAWMVLLIALVQIVITLIDYQYNVLLEQTYPLLDERTAVMGKIYALIDGASVGLQFLTYPILRFVGVPLTLLAIPVLLGGVFIGFAAQPKFLTLAFAKVFSKSFDYSLFRSAKEILYIPLSRLEKTLGKALVDVFTYRVAKAGASILLIVLQGFTTTIALVSVTLACIAGWFAVTAPIVRRFRRSTPREQELS